MSDLRNCPTCESPGRHLHPAMQHEGEVQLCGDPWHIPPHDAQEMTRDPLSTMDAKLWAVEFMRIFGERKQEIDEGLMIAWFANAIMRGYDQQAETIRRLEGENKTLLDAHEKLFQYQCPKAPPSCLMCGQVKPFSIKHLDLGSVGICGDCAALQARLTASEAKHKWTTARPTVAGWYWLRAPKHGRRDAVVWIEKDGDGPESYFYMPDDDSTPVDEIDGEWQGPLTPGEE